MKKLTIALGAVALAMGIQAATVQWGSGAIYTPGADGAFTDIKVANNSVTYYLWTFDDAADYAALTDVTKLNKASVLATGVNNALGGTATYSNSDKFEANGVVNWAILFIYTDADNKEWYIANKGTGTIDSLGSRTAFGNLASSSSTYATVSGWTAAGAIPEPTSGLLLLLGVAGLALKRKRA